MLGRTWANYLLTLGGVPQCTCGPYDMSLTAGRMPCGVLYRWAEGVDVFVSGAYAALQLGPGAGNLAGARTAAVRLVDLWRREPDGALDITRTAAKGTCGGADAACGACTGSTVASGGTAEVWPVAGGMEKAGAGPGKPVGSVVMSTAVGRGGKGARMVGRGRRQAGMAGGGGRRVEEGQVCDMA